MSVFRRRRRQGKRLPTGDAWRRADAGASQAESLWQTLYGPRGIVVAGRTVLDLGCSEGFMVRFLAEALAPRRVIGVDTVPRWDHQEDGWDRAALGDAVSFHQGDLATDDLLEAASVDVILCASMLHQLTPEAVEATLARCRSILRPGGEMIARVRCFTSSVGADLERQIDLPYAHLLYGERDLAGWIARERGEEQSSSAPAYVNWLTATTYTTMCIRAGFDVVDVTRHLDARAPHVRERVAAAFPWIDPAELAVAELDLHLVRPVTAEDLPAFGPVVGGRVAGDGVP